MEVSLNFVGTTNCHNSHGAASAAAITKMRRICLERGERGRERGERGGRKTKFFDLHSSGQLHHNEQCHCPNLCHFPKNNFTDLPKLATPHHFQIRKFCCDATLDLLWRERVGGVFGGSGFEHRLPDHVAGVKYPDFCFWTKFWPIQKKGHGDLAKKALLFYFILIFVCSLNFFFFLSIY